MFKPQLHVSMLNTKCEIAWQRRYGFRFGVWDKEERTPSNLAMMIGTCVHKTVQLNLQSAIDSKSLLSVDRVKEVARDDFEYRWKNEIVQFTDEEMADLQATRLVSCDQVVGLAAVHAEQIAPVLRPIELEKKFVIELPDEPIDLAGQIDIVERGCIRDTKTSKSKYRDDSLQSLQLAMYSLAYKVLYGELPQRVAYDVLIKTKTPQAQTVIGEPKMEWIDPLLHRIRRFIRKITVAKESAAWDIFMPVAPDGPNAWICSRRFCPFAESCQFWSRRD